MLKYQIKLIQSRSIVTSRVDMHYIYRKSQNGTENNVAIFCYLLHFRYLYEKLSVESYVLMLLTSLKIFQLRNHARRG